MGKLFVKFRINLLLFVNYITAIPQVTFSNILIEKKMT